MAFNQKDENIIECKLLLFFQMFYVLIFFVVVEFMKYFKDEMNKQKEKT